MQHAETPICSPELAIQQVRMTVWQAETAVADAETAIQLYRL